MRMKHALKNTVLLGLQTNIEFLHALLCDEDVAKGDTTTNLIENKWPKGWSPSTDIDTLALGAIACAISQSLGNINLDYSKNNNAFPDPFFKLNSKYP